MHHISRAKERAASIPTPSDEHRNRKAEQVSPSEIKTLSTLEEDRAVRFQHGVRFTYTDLFGTYHLLYLSRNDSQKIIHDRRLVDLVSVDETTNRLVLNIERRAFRSRSRRSLCLKVPGLTGMQAMVPWKSFIAVVERKRKMTSVSILERKS